MRIGHENSILPEEHVQSPLRVPTADGMRPLSHESAARNTVEAPISCPTIVIAVWNGKISAANREQAGGVKMERRVRLLCWCPGG
jgi:hypothetical protein